MSAVSGLIVLLNHVESCLWGCKMRNSYAINVGVIFPPWNDPYMKIEQIKHLKVRVCLISILRTLYIIGRYVNFSLFWKVISSA